MNIDDQKVQVADEIMRDIWKYLVSSDVEDDARYQAHIISSFATRYLATRFIYHNFEIKRHIDNQKVLVADEIKRDIC